MAAADPTRLAVLAAADTVVVKVGTNVLTDAGGRPDGGRIRHLAGQLHRLRASGRRVAVVTSGAIAAGFGRVGLAARPTDLPHLQACAAVGQMALMQLYQDALGAHGVTPAQVLLTAADLDSRARYLNARNTLGTLFEYGCLPVINENDTVSVAEIRFGDNDQLAAMVANMLPAGLLVLLTDVDGLYTADPRVDPAAVLVPTVRAVDRSVADLAGPTKSGLGTGGMRSKLKAARLATAGGVAVVMANGAADGVLDAVAAGRPVGTLFLPHGEPVPAWKRWVGFTARPRGTLAVDAGAKRALRELGKSLLPVGVRQVTGEFGKGDVVAVVGPDGAEFARGLSNYPAAVAARMAGRTTDQIAAALGRLPYPELVHRDNLAVTV